MRPPLSTQTRPLFRCATWLLCVALLVVPEETAVAQDAGGARATEDRLTAQLQWEVDPTLTCADSQAFRDIVAGRLGYDPFRVDADHVIVVSLRQRSHSLIGQVRSGPAERTLRAAPGECARLMHSLGVVVALMLDPFASPSTPEEQADTEGADAPEDFDRSAGSNPESNGVSDPPAPNPVSDPPEPESPTQEAPQTDSTTLQWFFGLGGGFSLGRTPGNIAPGVSALVGIGIDDWRIYLEGSGEFVPGTTLLDSNDRVQASAASARLSGCRGFISLLEACVGVRAGALHVRGLDLAESSTRTAFMWSVDLGLGLMWRYRAFFLRMLGEVAVAVTRPTLSIEGTEVWSASPIAGGAQLQIGFSIL